MRLPGSRGSLSRSFIYIVMAISLVLLGGQILLQRFFVGYVGGYTRRMWTPSWNG